MFQPSGALYSANAGIHYENVEVPHIDVRAPAATDVLFPIGKFWIWPGNGLWELNNLTSAGGQLTATWILLASGSGSGSFTTLTTTGTATIGGNETVAGTITATGNITTTGGNFVASGVASGLVLTPTVVAAGASPQTANGRVFSVTFSGVSIASGASQTFVISNSAVTGAATQVLLEWSGATAGSAVSIESQVQSAGTITIIMTNGTSATMVTDVANINFTGLVLN